MNPRKEPHWNKWTLELHGESSDPFDGLPLQTFGKEVTGLLADPVRQAMNVPISLKVRPRTTLGNRSYLLVETIPGYSIVLPGMLADDVVEYTCVKPRWNHHQCEQDCTEMSDGCRGFVYGRHKEARNALCVIMLNRTTDMMNSTACPAGYEYGLPRKGDELIQSWFSSASAVSETRNGIAMYAKMDAADDFRFVSTSPCSAEVLRTTKNGTPFQNLLHAGDEDDSNLVESCDVDFDRKSIKIMLVNETSFDGWGSGQEYFVTFFVDNPPRASEFPASFVVTSFDGDGNVTDHSVVPGISVANPVDLEIVNEVGQTGPNQTVDIAVSIGFYETILDGDEIVLHLPVNRMPGPNVCANYGPDGEFELPFNSLGSPFFPSCKCNGVFCSLIWNNFHGADGVALSLNESMRFRFTTTNPPETPYVTFNYWRLAHLRKGTVIASQGLRSWDIAVYIINSGLRNVRIKFANDKYRSAGSFADLSFVFYPTNYARYLEIVFGDNDVDLSNVTWLPNFDAVEHENARLVLDWASPGLSPGGLEFLELYNVKLGPLGGAAFFNITTYASVDGESWDYAPRDETVEISGGLHIPGRISVLEQPQMTTAWQELPDLHPVKAQLSPRAGEWTRWRFVLAFPVAVFAGEELVIHVQGDDSKLTTSGFELAEAANNTIIDSVVFLGATDQTLSARLGPGLPRTEVVLHPTQSYVLHLRANLASQPNGGPGSQLWRFDTVDGLRGCTNTNDGATAGPQLVASMGVSISVDNAVIPGGVVQLTLEVEHGNLHPEGVKVFAPAGFSFEPDCGQFCTSSQTTGPSDRPVAVVMTSQLNARRLESTASGGEKFAPLKIQLQVRAPMSSSAEIRFGARRPWLVEAYGGGGKVTGWGEALGFQVRDRAPGGTRD